MMKSRMTRKRTIYWYLYLLFSYIYILTIRSVLAHVGGTNQATNAWWHYPSERW